MSRQAADDPRDYGLTAADLHTAADRLYPPGDPRLDPCAGDHAEAAEFGRIRSRLCDLADAIEGPDPVSGDPAGPEPGGPHPFARPRQVSPDRAAPDKCMTCGRPGAAHGPADPMTVVRVYVPVTPADVRLYGICLRSTATRLAADAEPGAEVTDLGPAALLLTERFERLRDQVGASLVRVGTARGPDWITWFMPSHPIEPVPGTSGETTLRN